MARQPQDGPPAAFSRRFTAGELSPAFYPEGDLAKFHAGARRLRNMFVHVQGGASNRPGFQFVANAGYNEGQTRVIPFTFAVGQTYVLEFGRNYIRFFTNGTPIMNGDVPYQIGTPYYDFDLARLKFAQANDIITLTHPSYPPQDLKRYGLLDWRLVPVTFAATAQPPSTASVSAFTGLSGVPGVQAEYHYRITSVTYNPPDESTPTGDAVGINYDLGYNAQYGTVNTIRWSGVAGVDQYNVYRKYQGAFGFIGSTTDTSMIDRNTLPDTQNQPPIHYNPFANGVIVDVAMDANGSGYGSAPVATVTDPTGFGAILVPFLSGSQVAGVAVQAGGENYSAPTVTLSGGGGSGAAARVASISRPNNYPGSVGYFQQRKVYAGSYANPQTLWFTRTGNFSSMDTSKPVRSDDGIVATIAAQQDDAIEHIVSMNDIVLFTAAGVWKVSAGQNSDVITPSTIVAGRQAYNGCSPEVAPIVINAEVLYVQAKGGTVRDLAFNYAKNIYDGADLTQLAPHLFLGYTIKAWAWAQEPHKVLWAVRSDGKLLGLTYLKEQDIYAWHLHETQGFFTSVCVVSEGNEDVLYAVVQRYIGEVFRTYIERMHTRLLGPQNADVKEAWFVDSGLQYRGAPTKVVTGLGHLEGQPVSVLADGCVIAGRVVTGGVVTLPQPASIVTVGLPYQSVLMTLPIDNGDTNDQGKRKRVNRIRLFVENTRGLKAGIYDPARGPLLDEFKERTNEPPGTPPTLLTGQQFINAVGNWENDGCVWMQQDNPLPCTILAVKLDYALGT